MVREYPSELLASLQCTYSSHCVPFCMSECTQLHVQYCGAPAAKKQRCRCHSLQWPCFWLCDHRAGALVAASAQRSVSKARQTAQATSEACRTSAGLFSGLPRGLPSSKRINVNRRHPGDRSTRSAHERQPRSPHDGHGAARAKHHWLQRSTGATVAVRQKFHFHK